MDVKLIVVEGDTSADEVSVTLPAVIGRGRDAGVTLRHPLISRRHCELSESNGRMHVKDLNSLNGTFVDHNNIDEAIVPAGSLLTVGGYTFRVDYQDAGSGTQVSGTQVEDADTVSSGDDLAAAFAKMTDDSDSTDTAEQDAELNLGSLMDLAEADEETPSEMGDLDTAEHEVPQVEEDSPGEPIPTVQNVDDEIDLNAMFTEQVAGETPAPEPVTEAPLLDLEAISEPVVEQPVTEAPPLDLEAISEPVVESPVPPAAEEVLDLADLSEEAPADADTPAAEEVSPDLIEELEIVDPEQQGPQETEGDDDGLNSFLNNFK